MLCFTEVFSTKEQKEIVLCDGIVDRAADELYEHVCKCIRLPSKIEKNIYTMLHIHIHI